MKNTTFRFIYRITAVLLMIVPFILKHALGIQSALPVILSSIGLIAVSAGVVTDALKQKPQKTSPPSNKTLYAVIIALAVFIIIVLIFFK